MLKSKVADAFQPRAVRTIAVYRFGQPRSSEPAFLITKEQARWWLDCGAAVLGEVAGTLCDRGKALMLSRPTSDRLQLRSSLGTALTFRCLHGDAEAIAAVNSFRPSVRSPVRLAS